MSTSPINSQFNKKNKEGEFWKKIKIYAEIQTENIIIVVPIQKFLFSFKIYFKEYFKEALKAFK